MNARNSPTSLAAYARAVERLWVDALERPVILSARDWSLITDWHGRGVALQVVREAVEALAQRRRKSPPRGLGAVADAVSEGWEAIAGGRLARPTDDESASDPPAGDPLAGWRACLQRHAADETLRGLLRDLLRRQAQGTDPGELDRALDEALPAAVPPALREVAEREVDATLAPFRGRMPGAALRDTRRRAVADRLRGQLGLERLL